MRRTRKARRRRLSFSWFPRSSLSDRIAAPVHAGGISAVVGIHGLLALVVRASGNGPILFRQQRVGHGGKLFVCYKFRTMRIDAEEVLAAMLQNSAALREEWARDHKLRDDPRLARFGALLRRTSLDELPQLFNVLKGEMSIVGPRPITQSEVVRYGRYISAYHAVRPGLTGLWQVSGRSQTTYRRRVACDIAYARGRSPLYNIQIIARTVPAVFLSRGAY
jgi:lipopolysaccharide/colanic/teichoic acid biosynthesis glycosyltransferase